MTNPFKVGDVVKRKPNTSPHFPEGVITSISPDGWWIRFNGKTSGYSSRNYNLAPPQSSDAELAAQFRELMGKACDINDQLKARGFTIIAEVNSRRVFTIKKEIKL